MITSIQHNHISSFLHMSTVIRLSDASGELEMTREATGKIPRSALDPKDVFILDTGKAVYVWTGNETSSGEQRNGLSYAHVCKIWMCCEGDIFNGWCACTYVFFLSRNTWWRRSILLSQWLATDRMLLPTLSTMNWRRLRMCWKQNLYWLLDLYALYRQDFYRIYNCVYIAKMIRCIMFLVGFDDSLQLTGFLHVRVPRGQQLRTTPQVQGSIKMPVACGWTALLWKNKLNNLHLYF